eukprot:scaffold47912_cov73-Phaeocystis_antarctica.AAC.4
MLRSSVLSSTCTLSTSGPNVYDVVSPPCTNVAFSLAKDSQALPRPVSATLASRGNSIASVLKTVTVLGCFGVSMMETLHHIGMYDGVCQSSTQVSMGRPALRIDTCTRSVVSAPMSHVLRLLPSILIEGDISQMPSVREASPSTRGEAQRGAAQHGDGPWMAPALPTRRAATASFICDARRECRSCERRPRAGRGAGGEDLFCRLRAHQSAEQEDEGSPGVACRAILVDEGEASSKALSSSTLRRTSWKLTARTTEGEQGCAAFPRLHNLPRGL